MSEILSIRSVSAGYGSEIVLRDIDLNVHDQDFIGIIGPNGGGKTTLLRVMMGLLKPMRGSVEVRINKDLSSTFGYLPQVTRTDPSFPIPVLEVVLSGLMRQGSWMQRPTTADKLVADALLKMMGIFGIRHKSMGELSGGQRQRALVARAVIAKPSVLVLDEPNTFVDSNFEKDLYALLAELNKEMAIIVVSHDLGMISSHVKTIACVNRGLHYHPGNVITEELLTAYNCPIDLIAHGELPHRILKEHDHTGHGHH